jgi:hypothetical protein
MPAGTLALPGRPESGSLFEQEILPRQAFTDGCLGLGLVNADVGNWVARPPTVGQMSNKAPFGEELPQRKEAAMINANKL